MSVNPHETMQRAWLDVRCSALGSRQYDSKMAAFLQSFVDVYRSRADPTFKCYFANGGELVNCVVRCFSAHLAKILTTGGDSDADAAASGFTLTHFLIRALLVLVNYSDYAGKSIAELASTFECIEVNGVMSGLLSLHNHKINSILSASGVQAPLLRLDVDCLLLIARILRCPQRGFVRRSVVAATQAPYIKLMASTVLKCNFCVAVFSGDCIKGIVDVADNAARVFAEQVSCAPNAEAVGDAIEIMETGANSSRTQHSGAESPVAALICYTCLLESILCVRTRFGFATIETLRFSPATAQALAAEADSDSSGNEPADMGDARRKACARLASCLEMFATAHRHSSTSSSPAGTPSRDRGAGSFFQRMPGTLNKLQQRLTSTFTGDEAPGSPKRGGGALPVSCPDTVVPLVSVFVSTRVTSTAETFGETLFRILRYRHTAPDVISVVLNVCIDNIRTLGAARLETVLQFLTDIDSAHDITPFAAAIIEAFKNGGIPDGDSKLAVLDFMLAVATRSSSMAALVLSEELFPACLVNLSEMLLDGLPDAKTFTDKMTVLSKVVVQRPESARELTEQNVPRLLLDAMLLACRSKVPAVSVLLSNMYTNLVVRTGTFYNTLVTAIASSSASKPWREESSSLLATLVATLQTAKHLDNAVDQNAIELCLTMVHDISDSSTPKANLQLLGCCLGFLLPRVAHSTVWSQYDAAAGSMRCTRTNTQFVIDLCSGYFVSTVSCTACQRYFELGDESCFAAAKDMEAARLVTMDTFFVPQRPFLQLQHPLITLIAWCQGGESSPESDAGPAESVPQDLLRRILRYLLVCSETKLPNHYLSDYIASSGDTQLLCCLRDVSEQRHLPLFFGAGTSLDAVLQRETAWLSALAPPVVRAPFAGDTSAATSLEHRFNAQFAGNGGASGVVTCVGEQWPSPDGYTVVMLVHWESMNETAPSDGKNVLWQLAWDPQRNKTLTVSLSINPKQRCAYYTLQSDGEATTVQLPFIPEDEWTHVVLCHHRARLFGTQLKTYYNGVLVLTARAPYPSTALQTAASVLGTGGLGAACDVTCTVGAPQEKPNGRISLRFIDLQVYNTVLSLEDVVAVFCSGARCPGQGNWDTPGESLKASLLAPYLRDEVLRALRVGQAHGDLAAMSQRESVVVRAIPEGALLRLHARSMTLVDETVGRAHTTKNWVIVNCTNATSTPFRTHGHFIPPQAGMANEVDALLSHGAIYEWVCWLDAISACAQGPADPETPEARERRLGRASEAAQRFLRILAAANKQTELSPSTWRRLLGRVIEEAIRSPDVYLFNDAALRSLLSLSVRRVPGGAGPALDDANSSPAACPRTLSADVLYFTTLMEHLFFNWKVLARLPALSFHVVLEVIRSLIDPANPFREVNALRLRAADFVNGFMCGMFREYVEPARLRAAMRCVEMMLVALHRKAEFLSEVLTVCAVSTRPQDVNLGSKLAAACPAYADLVRNSLLRALGAAWDSFTPVEKSIFARTMSSVAPGCWFIAMSARGVHPVTVALTMRVFTACYFHCDSFREAFKGDRLLLLAESLSQHAHHRDVMDTAFYAFLGLVWPGPDGAALLAAGTVAPSDYSQLFLRTEGGSLPFTELLLCLVRELGHVLLMRPDELEAFSRADSGPGRALLAREYFTSFDLRAATPRAGCRRRFKAVALAVLCAVRLANRAAKTPAPDKGIRPTTRDMLDSTARTSAAAAPVVVMRIICDVVDWLATHYRTSRSLRKALYRSDRILNPTDLLGWTVLCTLDAKSVEHVSMPSDVAHQRGSNESAGEMLPFTPISPRNAAVSLPFDATTSTVRGDDEWEDVGKDYDDDDEDEDWELLPSVLTTDSRSYGLDRLRPRPGFEPVYDSCRSFFLVHALERVQDGDEFALPRSRVRTSKFVLALHRALAAQPRGVGNQLEDCRAAFLCCTWMKAAEQAIDCASSSSSSPPGLRNVLSLGDYMLSRLVSGAAVAPLAMSSFFRFMLTRLDKNTDVVRRSRTWLFEWLMYIVNSSYYKGDAERASFVVDMLSANQDVLFETPMPAGDLLRIVTLRLLELTHACLGPTADPHSGDAGGECSAAVQKLASIWSVFIRANGSAPVLLDVLQARGKTDLWTDGFDALTHPPPVKEASNFVDWLIANKVQILRCFQGVSAASAFPYSIAEGGKNAKLMKKSVRFVQGSAGEQMRFVAEARRRSDALWLSFTNTATFVDPAIVEHGGYTFPNSCVVGVARGDAALGLANEQQSWFLHQSGTVGVKELYAHENVDDLASEPISLYIRYPPPVCIPVRLSKNDATSPYCALRWNALATLSKITGQHAVRWVGNVYYVVGNDSRICTLTVSDREVVLISCSEFTKDGDFFVAQIRPQNAKQESGLTTSFIQHAWRRLLTSAGGSGSGHQSGTATTSKAAFRYSQYYRQLRTEALVNADALVWRFPLGHVASVHQRLFQHMPAGLELVLETGERFMIVVLDEELSFSKSARDQLQVALAEYAPLAQVETMSSKRAKLTTATRRWANGEMDNFSYLTALNDTASRSASDIGQYPVMPWVLSDYKSDSLDLECQAVYRNLTKPVGAINAAKAQQLERRYTEWAIEGETPFHYGTHYSSGAIVLYYLLRLQPFTARSIAYQGGRLDIADRLFHSLPEAWDNCRGVGSGDVKELIPEFFSLGSFLVNKNRTALGVRRDGRQVADVVLPPWCRQSPTLFTHLNAAALESPFVSERLADWIDLVFGYKQTGDAARDAVNVFHNLSYQEGVERAINDAVSEEDRKAIVASADNFGQTPVQLFAKAPHPRRNLAVPAWQHHLIANAKTIFAAEVLPQGRVSTVTRGVPLARLYAEDGVLYGCPRNHLMTTREPIEVFAYDGRTDSISSTFARQTKPNATLPSIVSLGCGEFACMCASPSGNLLCVGTATGKVVVFTRTNRASLFTVTTVLHSAQDREDRVLSLQQFGEGCLIVTHAATATVTGWHLSPLGSMFCFQLQLPPCEGDASPVACVTQDVQRGVYYGARGQSLALFTKEGVLLRLLNLSPFLETLLVKLGPGTDPFWNLTAAAFCNCSSFCDENILVLGHRNGLVTLWVVQPVTYTDVQTEPEFYKIRYLHCLACDSDVRSLLLLRSGGIIVAGLGDGTIAQFCYHSIEEEEPLLFMQ